MHSNSWRDSLSFLDQEKVTHEVCGKQLVFYPVSLGKIIALRDVAKKMGTAVSVLFDSKGNDTSSREMEGPSDDGKGKYRQMHVEAISPELLRARLDARNRAIETLIDAVTSRENTDAIGALIMDSLRDVFPINSPNNPPPVEFIASTPAAAIIQMLVGVAKANKGMFGPLGSKIGQLKNALESAVNQRLTDLQNQEKPKAQDKEEDEEETPGSNYKITSPGSSSEPNPRSSSLG